jgi:hypothetical protein
MKLQGSRPSGPESLQSHEPYGVREPGGISLTGCHPNRVQARKPDVLTRVGYVLERSFPRLRVVYGKVAFLKYAGEMHRPLADTKIP